MKRSLSITLLFVGLNVLIFWITSIELGEPEVVTEDPLSTPVAEPEELLEESTTPALKSDESARAARPLLLTTQNEARTRSLEEIQQGAAKAITSMVQVYIHWKGPDGVWQKDRVNAVCVDGNGLYATAWSRISQGEVFRILHQDGSFSESRLDSFDPTKGIALLRSSEPEKSKPAVFASGLSVPFGSPLQFIWLDRNNQPQAVRGYLSGVKYDSLSGFPEVISGYLLPDMQLGAHQQGGMLIDLEGRMAGLLIDSAAEAVSTSILSVEDILHVCRHLKQLGYVSRSDFGIFTQRLNPDLARGLGWDAGASGVVVTQVKPGMPAEEAGIRAGDLIVELNGRKVMGAGFFQSVLSRWPEDKSLVFGVQREAEIQNLELTPVTVPKVAPPSVAEIEAVAYVLETEDIEPSLTGEIREIVIAGNQERHLVVTAIDPRHVLFSPPLLAGDVVIRVVGVASPEPMNAEALAAHIMSMERTVLLAYRNGRYFWTSARKVSAQ